MCSLCRRYETGWAGRIRTFDTGSKVRGLTAWRPPTPNSYKSSSSAREDRCSSASESPLAPSFSHNFLILCDYFFLDHSSSVVVDRMSDIFISPILAFFAGHRDEISSRAADDLEVSDHEA